MGEVIKAQPWLPRAMIDTFDSWDTKNWKMWEFGSGFSTAWFAERVQTLWSMEHTEYWHGAAKNACDRKGLKNVHLLLGKRGLDYQEKITNYPDGVFDCVLVDGRDRVECFKRAIPKTSKVIILDNGLRDRYSSVHAMMEDLPEWEKKIAKWTDPVIRDGKVVPEDKSWHSIVWVKKGAKLK